MDICICFTTNQGRMFCVIWVVNYRLTACDPSALGQGHQKDFNKSNKSTLQKGTNFLISIKHLHLLHPLFFIIPALRPPSGTFKLLIRIFAL